MFSNLSFGLDTVIKLAVAYFIFSAVCNIIAGAAIIAMLIWG